MAGVQEPSQIKQVQFNLPLVMQPQNFTGQAGNMDKCYLIDAGMSM